MKQRMYNTFYRKISNKFIAGLLTSIGYFILKIYYYAASIFLKKIKEKNELSVEKAQQNISRIRPKPDMRSKAVNKLENKSVNLSIIVPAYNVEKFIGECLKSIFEQETKYRYEVIIVNDGATDSTESVIKKFEDKRMIYIKQDNGGLSAARNKGLDMASGKYVMFVDSDDILYPKAIENMLDSIYENDADAVVGSYYMFDDKSGKRQSCINIPKIIVDDAKKAVQNPGYAWGKVYKRELFKKNRFPVGVWYEDTMICSIIYRLCKKIVVLDDVVCGYRINPNGISRTARSSPKSIDHYWVMEDVLDKAKDNKLENDFVFYEIAFSHMSTFLYRRVSLMDDEIIRSIFIMACDLLKQIRPAGYEIEGGRVRKDLEQAFKTGNYKLWKLASFLI